MIRIAITTGPDWSPTPHGSSHSDPGFSHRLMHAKISAGLIQIPQLIANNSEHLGLPPATSGQPAQIRYYDSSPADMHTPDIEIQILIDTELTRSGAERLHELVLDFIDKLLDQQKILRDPSITISIDQVHSHSIHRRSDGSIVR